MTDDTKQQTKQVSKIVGVIAAASAIMVGVTNLVTPAKQPVVGWTWSYPAIEIPDTIFEIQYKTNLNGPWMFYTNIVGTNVLIVPKNLPQAFFTISRCSNKTWTNIYVKQKGF